MMEVMERFCRAVVSFSARCIRSDSLMSGEAGQGLRFSDFHNVAPVHTLTTQSPLVNRRAGPISLAQPDVFRPRQTVQRPLDHSRCQVRSGSVRLCMNGFSTASATQALFTRGVTLSREPSCPRTPFHVESRGLPSSDKDWYQVSRRKPAPCATLAKPCDLTT